MQRREFLHRTMSAAALTSLGSTLLSRESAALASTTKSSPDNILIVLQMTGGNDGLNTVVPYRNDHYIKSRPTLRLKKEVLCTIDDEFALPNSLAEFRRLMDDGLLAAIHGVGTPKPEQDHGKAMHVWQDGRQTVRTDQTGWIGRLIDENGGRDNGGHDKYRVPAFFVGDIAMPLTLQGKTTTVPGIRGLDELKQRLAFVPPVLTSSTGDDVSGPTELRESMQAACDAAARIKRTMGRNVKSDGVNYPPLLFAKRLQTTATLIRADLGVRIFYVELGGVEPGGFDTHAGQALNHGALLEQLSKSVTAFVDEMKQDGLLDRILMLTFSEFGRTTVENGRRGTDHGSAQPLFAIGGKVNAGLIGTHPDIADLSENAGQKHSIDFREVFKTAAVDWLGMRTESDWDKFKTVPFIV